MDKNPKARMLLIPVLAVMSSLACTTRRHVSSASAAEVRRVALEVLTAEARGDADTVFKLWDPLSPERMSRRRHLLEPVGVREVSTNITLKDVQIAGDKASVTFLSDSQTP